MKKEVYGMGLGKTAIDLVGNENVLNKTGDFLGMLFPYVGLKKKAVERYTAEIEKSDISADAKVFAILNMKKQMKMIKNQGKIAEIAIQNAKEERKFASGSKVSEDWLEHFMNSAAFVSDENMQLIWGKILSNEFDNPGTTPLSMARILSEMQPAYAKAFRKLCGMRFYLISISDDGKVANASWEVAVPFSKNGEFMGKLGISLEMINELETIGVIKLNGDRGFSAAGTNAKKALVYINGRTLETIQQPPDGIPIGNVLLTSAGEALQKITEVAIIEGYDEVMKKYMCDHGVVFSDEEHFQVDIDGDTYRITNIGSP